VLKWECRVSVNLIPALGDIVKLVDGAMDEWLTYLKRPDPDGVTVRTDDSPLDIKQATDSR
jgi:hypothetical protein